MTDGIATEIGQAPVSTIDSPSPRPFIFPSPQSPAAEPQVAVESAPVQEISLREKYAGDAARYRELSMKQFNGLSSEELKEKRQLDEKASFGLFEQGLSDDQLVAKDAGLKSYSQAQGDPQQLAEEYRRLGRQLFDQGLKGSELARYNSLDVLAKQGKFELSQAT